MKKNVKKAVVMVTLIILFCAFMAVVDGVFKADYFIKSIIKFISIPLLI